jgi:hypothetical protein
MSEESKTELQGKTQQLLHGRLKHIRAAVLVAALVPLASVPATAQQFFPTPPASGGAPGISVGFTQGCTGYTLTFVGFGIGKTGSTAAVSYTIVVAPSSPPVTATITSPITVTSIDASGNFAASVSGMFAPALMSGDTVLVTAMLAGATGSSILQTTSPSSCSPPPASVPLPCDFVTSGGFVRTDVGAMANFGSHGGCKLGGFWGHVNYVDHTNGYHIDSVEITGYLTPTDASSRTRDICGWARTNNPSDPQPVMFRVRLIDNGEPGIADQFGIRLSTGYVVSTRLLNNGMGGGGNVHLHKDNPSTTGPSPVPTEAQMCGGLLAP